MATVTCIRCGETREGLAFQPFQNDLGRRAFETICGVCWAEWLKTQQQLINHYGLNLRDQQAKEFLFRNMEQFLFSGTGSQAGGGAAGEAGGEGAEKAG
ncbi:MAG TPA: oxidative damage protection protein [Gemmatimonadales bacterium]|nr:oxidative damage protection protein [Gemmatimonadales bacterium]